MDWNLFICALLVVLGSIFGVYSLKEIKEDFLDVAKGLLSSRKEGAGLQADTQADLTVTYLLGKLDWCAEKIANGARVYAVQMQRDELPGNLLPADAEPECKKALILVLATPEGREKELVECVLYNTMDTALAALFDGKDAIELVV